MMTITEFCDKHRACAEGREWALANCKDMHEAWMTCSFALLRWIMQRPGVFDQHTLVQIALECAKTVEHLLTDERSKAALIAVQGWLDGIVTTEQMQTVRMNAWAAAWAADAAAYAANAAAYAANAAAAAAAADANQHKICAIIRKYTPNFD